MNSNGKTAGIILAAGRGTRMKGYAGSKALLPLVPGNSPYEGSVPILLEIIRNLPAGPKAVVVHHRREDIMSAAGDIELTYCEQPVLNGTGGALLASRSFLESVPGEDVIITMGDVPLVKKETFARLLRRLKDHRLVVLGFEPPDRKQYGVLETEGDRVCRITEWKYWRQYPEERQASLTVCNSGIYAAGRRDLLHYLDILAARPHVVRKEINGRWTDVEEFFITDIVEYMCDDGLAVGYITGAEEEVMGVDDLASLEKAQKLYRGI